MVAPSCSPPGPDYASESSLWGTALADILPAEPTGGVIEEPFKPRITELGKRHPVTRDLPGSASDPPAWSDWFRTIETTPRGGTAIMSGAHGQPLLVLARQDKGRVALLLSDHAWLWARGYQGGGPHVDLLRRLSHWLMKEPDLEEEALRALVRRPRPRRRAPDHGRQRRADHGHRADRQEPATLTLTRRSRGFGAATMRPTRMGLWRVSDGTLTALANVGPANPREYQEVVSTTDRLKGLADETGRPRAASPSGRTGSSCPASRPCRRQRPVRRRRLDRRQGGERQRRARRLGPAALRRAARPGAAARRPAATWAREGRWDRAT